MDKVKEFKKELKKKGSSTRWHFRNVKKAMWWWGHCAVKYNASSGTDLTFEGMVGRNLKFKIINKGNSDEHDVNGFEETWLMMIPYNRFMNLRIKSFDDYGNQFSFVDEKTFNSKKKIIINLEPKINTDWKI
jgi:hypothetical protein